jgi:probable phosphoglycerate mutase
MTALLLVRHAPTSWNAEGRLMGRADPPLSAEGRAVLARWRLPPAFAGAPILASPLRRARETAAALGPHVVEPRLVEMDWGRWEGHRLADLRRADPAGTARLEALGPDLRPPGGERLRDVQCRLRSLCSALASAERAVLVTHKGVLRAALALATGWDYRAKPPVKLAPGDALRVDLDARGLPESAVDVVTLTVPAGPASGRASARA